MDIYDQILENLELERELGTRAVEMDRALLVPPKPEPPPERKPEPPPAPAPRSSPQPAPPPKETKAVAEGECDILFLTANGLSDAGMEAMRKTFAAMRKIRADVKVAMDVDAKAKAIVILGSDALRKRLPMARPVRGAWIALDGVPAIMTFSPDFIFRHFREGSPGMKQAKVDMWNDIKLAIGRLPPADGGPKGRNA